MMTTLALNELSWDQKKTIPNNKKRITEYNIFLLLFNFHIRVIENKKFPMNNLSVSIKHRFALI